MNVLPKANKQLNRSILGLRKQISWLNFAYQEDTAWINVLVIVFLVLGLIGILNHEMWRDELQAWMIARDSSSLIDLYRNLRYEGHPSLWYIFLYAITRFTDNPLAMQLFHLLITSGTIYVFAKFSPFTKLQKILFTFGYFPFYEYHLISRNYSLGILLIFLFCHIFTRQKRNYIVLSVILAFLANTNVYSLIIAISLAVTIIFEKFLNRSSNFNKRLSLINIAILTCGIAMAILQIIPPNDAKFQGIAKQDLTTINHINYLLFTILPSVWKSYIPIPNFLNYNFWNTNAFINDNSSKLVLLCICLLSLLLLLSAIALFNQKPIVLFAYAFGTCTLIWFAYEKFFGSLRHHGHLFILFIACIWISTFYPESNRPMISFIKGASKFLGDRKNQYINFLLCIHLLSGVHAYSMDLIHPFSASKEVAKFITNRQLENSLIIGSQDNEVSPIAALLKRPIYYFESSRYGSFINWNQRQNLNFQAVASTKLNRLVQQNNRKNLLILSHKLNQEIPGLYLTEIYNSTQSIAPGETYYLYQVEF
ncbi:hypothetical protein B7486_20555 [cyanobacterium TDX16]|nr:hypothetical protein B7486_20555 [cyanobacterium TDX16]